MCCLQVQALLSPLSDYMKEWDVASGKHRPRIIYDVYVPDMRYVTHVLLPEVSCFIAVHMFEDNKCCALDILLSPFHQC